MERTPRNSAPQRLAVRHFRAVVEILSCPHKGALRPFGGHSALPAPRDVGAVRHPIAVRMGHPGDTPC